MLRPILFISLLSIFPNAFAGYSDVGEAMDANKKLILCERRLDPRQVDEREAILREDFYGRPFIGWMVHDMTSAGLVKAGLPAQSDDRDLKSLVLTVDHGKTGSPLVVKLSRYKEGKFESVLEYFFSDPSLAAHEAVYIRKEHDRLDHDGLTREYPPGSGRRGFRVGYQSAPDKDGVRRYIAFEEDPGSGDQVSSWIEFGLDVPYDKAGKYSEDLTEVTDELRAESGRYRRIAVLHYARVDN